MYMSSVATLGVKESAVEERGAETGTGAGEKDDEVGLRPREMEGWKGRGWEGGGREGGATEAPLAR